MNKFYWTTDSGLLTWSRLFLGDWVNWTVNKEFNGVAVLRIPDTDGVSANWLWAVTDIFGMNFFQRGGGDAIYRA